MASPISKSPRRGRSPSPRSPRYKFTIFPPDVYAPITLSYMPSTDKSYKFCSFLKDKFENHFGMRCSLPTAAGTAYIGDFDEFERLFLIDAEYVVVVVTQKSVTALRKFYPRLLVFVTVRPEWVNRFILVFVGDVALDPSIDLSVLIHQPIIFKESDWEADLETWKALHKLLKVEWTPHKEDRPSPTRRGEVLSVIQRTVVETEVQEVRTRRRSSSRNSDNDSATPGTLSPLPGASRKLAPSDGTDLYIVSPGVEKPSVVEEMASGRRKFGGEPEVETTKPVVLESPPTSNNERKPTPKVVIQRPNDTSKPDVPEVPSSPSNERKPTPKVVIQRPNDTSKPDVPEVPSSPSNERKPTPKVVIQRPNDTSKPDVPEVPSSPSNERKSTPKVVIQRPNDTSKPDVPEAPSSPSNERKPTPKVVIKRPNDNGATSKSPIQEAEKGAAAPKVQIVRETPKPNAESQKGTGEKARPSSLFGAAKSGEAEKAKEKRSDKKDSWKFASEVRTKKSRDKPEEQNRKAEDGRPTAVEEPVTASKGRSFRSTPPTKTQQETAFENQAEKTARGTPAGDRSNESEEIITPQRKTGQRSAPTVDNGKLELEITAERNAGQRAVPSVDNGKSEREITPRSKTERAGQEPKTETAEKKVDKEVLNSNNKDKETAPGNKGDKESAQDSVQTSGYSSLDSSISTRSMGQIPATPVSIKVSPFEGESSTDVSYVTAPETLSLPAPQHVALSTDRTGEKPVETPEISDVASLPSETADKQEVEAFQLPKESDETKETSSLGKSVEALAGPHQPGQVVERKFEEDGRTVNVKVSSEAARHPFTGAPVISKAIEIDVEGDDDETFFFSTEFDEMSAAPPPPLNISDNDESVVRLRRNLRLLETAFGGQEEAAAVPRRRRGHSGGEVERPHSSSSITVSSDVEDTSSDAPARYRTTMTVSRSTTSSLKEKSTSLTSLHPDFNIFTVPRTARSVENVNAAARETFQAPEAFIVTTQMPDMSCARPRSLTAIPATPDTPPTLTFEVGSPGAPRGDVLHVTSTKELFTHTVGVVEVSGEPEVEVATIQEPRVLTGLEVSLPESKDSPVTSKVKFLASGVETASPQRTATMELEIGGQEPPVTSHRVEEAGQTSPCVTRTFTIPGNDKRPGEDEITAQTTASLNVSPSAAENGTFGTLEDTVSSGSILDGASPNEGLSRTGPEKVESRQVEENGKKPEEGQIAAQTTSSLNTSPPSVGRLGDTISGAVSPGVPNEGLPKSGLEKTVGAEKPESGKVILTARRSGKDSANPGKFILTARKAEQGSANPGKVILTARKADQDTILPSPGKVILTPRKADSAGPGKVVLTARRANPDDKTSGSPVAVEEMDARTLGNSAEDLIVPDDAKRQRTSPGETPLSESNVGAMDEEGNFEFSIVASRDTSRANDGDLGKEGRDTKAPGETRTTPKLEDRESETAAPKTAYGSSIPILEIQPATPIDSVAKSLGPVSGENNESPSMDSLLDDRARLNVSPPSPPRLPTAAVTPSPKLPSVPSAGPRKVGSVPGVSRSSDGSYYRTDSRERCLIDDLSYASLTSEEDGLRIMRRDESLEEPVFDDDKEEKQEWMLTNLTLRLPRSLMSAGTVMLNSTWLMASNAGIAVGRLVWPTGKNFTDKPNRPFRILILATATALSPLYRQLSMSFFEMLSTFLWPSVEGMIESGVVSFPVAEISADSSVLVTETMPQLTSLSIVSPSQFGRSSPTELLMPAQFVFWVTTPPR